MSVSIWITLLIRLMFGLLFLIYGLGKIFSYGATVKAISSGFAETWVPIFLVNIFVYVMPFWEALVGLSFLLGFKYRSTLIATGILMTLLIVGMAVQGDHATIGRNLVYFLILLVGLRHSEGNRFALKP